MDLPTLERHIAETHNKELDFLILLKNYQPDNLTNSDKDRLDEKWKAAMINHYRKKGLAKDSDTIDDIWKQAETSVLKNIDAPQEHDTFEFKTDVISNEQLKEDELAIPNLSLHKCIISSNGFRSVLISRQWLSLDKEEQDLNLQNKYVALTADIPAISIRVSCPEFVSCSQEVQSCLVYLDISKTHIDWLASIRNLQEYSMQHSYDMNMIKMALLNFIKMSTRFGDTQYFAEKTANEIARTLLRSAAQTNKHVFHRTKLYALTRQPQQPLSEILEIASQYITALFPGEKDAKQRENYMLLALVSFVNDELSSYISTQIKVKRSIGDFINYEHYKDICLKMEAQKDGMPSSALRYNRRVDSIPAISMNIFAEDESPYKKLMMTTGPIFPYQNQTNSSGNYVFVKSDMSYDLYFHRDSKYYKMPIIDLDRQDLQTIITSETHAANQMLPYTLNTFPTQVSKTEFDMQLLNPHNGLTQQEKTHFLQQQTRTQQTQPTPMHTPITSPINQSTPYTRPPAYQSNTEHPPPPYNQSFNQTLPLNRTSELQMTTDHFNTDRETKLNLDNLDPFSAIPNKPSGLTYRSPIENRTENKTDNRKSMPMQAFNKVKQATERFISPNKKTRSREDLTGFHMQEVLGNQHPNKKPRTENVDYNYSDSDKEGNKPRQTTTEREDQKTRTYSQDRDRNNYNRDRQRSNERSTNGQYSFDRNRSTDRNGYPQSFDRRDRNRSFDRSTERRNQTSNNSDRNRSTDRNSFDRRDRNRSFDRETDRRNQTSNNSDRNRSTDRNRRPQSSDRSDRNRSLERSTDRRDQTVDRSDRNKSVIDIIDKRNANYDRSDRGRSSDRRDRPNDRPNRSTDRQYSNQTYSNNQQPRYRTPERQTSYNNQRDYRQRVNSRDNTRQPSGSYNTYNNRPYTPDRQYRPRSSSYNSGNRQYNGRTPSRDRQYSNRNSFPSTPYPRSTDQGRNPNYANRDRSDSRPRNYRDESRSPTFNRNTDSIRRSRRDGNDDKQMDRQNSGNRQNRQNSLDKFKFYKACKPGQNCSSTYNPLTEKFCSKCSSKTHHPFDCALYDKWNPLTCNKCNIGHHFPESCKNRPTNVNVNSLLTACSDELSQKYLPKDIISELANKISANLSLN